MFLETFSAAVTYGSTNTDPEQKNRFSKNQSWGPFMGVLTPLFHPLICKCANARGGWGGNGGGVDRQNRAKTYQDPDSLPESLRNKEAPKV